MMLGMVSTESTQIESPWGSRAFVSRLAAQISLPYRRPPDGVTQIVKRNGDLVVTLSAAKGLPYGRYPRLVELWLTTMVKTWNPCVDMETRTVEIGSTFRGFMALIGTPIGGKQMRGIKSQLEAWLASTYTISSDTGRYSRGLQFLVGEQWHIDWLQHEPQEDALFANYFVVSQEYFEMLQDSPVPVDLGIIAKLRKPMSIDIYCWLQRRYFYLREPQSISWEQLREQFGSDTEYDYKFRQSFKNALKDVLRVYPAAKITCGKTVTLYPSKTTTTTRLERDKRSHGEISEMFISRVLEQVSPSDDQYITVRRLIIRCWKQGMNEAAIIDAVKNGC